jgi:hypothetical protein
MPDSSTHSSKCLLKFIRLSALAAAFIPFCSGLAASTNLTWKADFTLKETYDDNVYLQNNAPPSTMPDAVPAKKSSWVTTLTPHVGLDYKFGTGFKASLSYAPDVAVYHNTPSEDNTTHRGVTTFSGAAGDAVWEQTDTFTYIDGSRTGPIFGRITPGPSQDVPAIGGIPLRDRRAAFIYRGGFKLTWTLDRFFIRPVASAYVHDFNTIQKLSAPLPGECYENYLDRQDVNGGVDIGYEVGNKTYLVLGYRYGRQDQFTGPNATSTAFTDSPYDSSYHRILFGVEGNPAKWIKLAALGGPEIRDWASGTYAGFDRNRIDYWVDATATIMPDKNDAVTLLFRRLTQPAFSSQSIYDDITYSAMWKHTFNEHFSASAGMQLYIGDWQAPVYRDDWIYTPSAGLTYTCNKHFSVEAACSGDWAKNKTSTSAPKAQYADGREFTRHLVSLAMKCTF